MQRINRIFKKNDFNIRDLDSDSIYIIIYRFNTERENLEIQEENDSVEEDYAPMDIDNYYLDQEYWFEGDE